MSDIMSLLINFLHFLLGFQSIFLLFCMLLSPILFIRYLLITTKLKKMNEHLSSLMDADENFFIY